MKTGNGQKTHLTTTLPNGYKVSTIKINGMWETMVFDKYGDEIHVEHNKYINEAKHAHNRNVYSYIAA